MIISELDKKFEELSVKMSNLANSRGKGHPDTIAVSEELDKVIITMMKLKYSKKKTVTV